MVTARRRPVAGALAALLLLAGCASEMKPRELAAEYYNLGNGFFGLGKYDRAIRYYEMALERNPALADARWNLALANLRAGSYDVAEKGLREWLERDPDSVEAREALALTLRGQGRRQDALAMLEEILARAPEDTAALNNKAIVLWELGRSGDAAQAFLRYLEFEPYDPDTLYNLMELSREQGMDAKALEYAELYLSAAEASGTQDEEDVVSASLLAARQYARSGVYYKALEVYGRVLELDEARKDAWFEQAEILLTAVEDPARGIESLTRALEAGFADRQRIALLCAREDLLDRGRVEDLLRARKLEPGASELDEARRSAGQGRARRIIEPRGPQAEPPSEPGAEGSEGAAAGGRPLD